MKKIFVTGGSGFIGRSLIRRLLAENYKVVAPCRNPGSLYRIHDQISFPFLSDINKIPPEVDWFDGCECVVHLAGRAHLTEGAANSLEAFRKVNVDGTLELARRAASAGVKRLIFLSSIGVNGNHSDTPFCFSDNPAPKDNYARSKLEAEIGLKQVALESGIEVVILRPPLVYGADAPGNFGKLVKLVERNWPLPLGAIYNKRSFVAVDNLVDLVCACIEHCQAPNKTFLVSDDQDVSTTELLKIMAHAMDKSPLIIPIPMIWLDRCARLIGKKAIVNRLCGSLQVDISHTKNTLNWKPPVTLEEGIERCFQ